MIVGFIFLFLSTFAYADLESLAANCEKRPVFILMRVGKLDKMAPERVSAYITEQIRDELPSFIEQYKCNKSFGAQLETLLVGKERKSWRRVISYHQDIIQRKIDAGIAPRIAREEVSASYAEIQKYSRKLGDERLTIFDRYLYQGAVDEVALLQREIADQSYYRDPTALIEKLTHFIESEEMFSLQTDYDDLAFKELTDRGRAAASARKASCGAINNLGGAVTVENVRNQGEVGWCASFASADMVSNKLGVRVSAIDIANAYNDNIIANLDRSLSGKAETEIDGATAGGAIRRANRRGFCKEEALPENGPFSTPHLDYFDILKRIEQGYLDFHSGDLVEGCSNSNFISDCRSLLPNINTSQLFSLIENSSWTDFIDLLIEENCKGQRLYLPRGVKPKTLFHPFHSKNRLWSTIDEQLEQGAFAAFSYNENILHDHRDFSISSAGVFHLSLIVGRRFNEANQSCEYLVRNSHGDWCDGYDKEVYECNNGHIWVSEQYLNRSLRSVTYLK